MKKKTIISIMLVLILMTNNVVYASDKKEDANTNNLETMDDIKRADIIYDIIESILEHDISRLNKNNKYITDDTYNILSSYVLANTIGTGNISDYMIDTSGVSQSSTVDYVILANLKINYEENNMMYLFEFHINANGLIYGYNIWVY